jgi:hypothetical protein
MLHTYFIPTVTHGLCRRALTRMYTFPLHAYGVGYDTVCATAGILTRTDPMRQVTVVRRKRGLRGLLWHLEAHYTQDT